MHIKVCIFVLLQHCWRHQEDMQISLGNIHKLRWQYFEDFWLPSPFVDKFTTYANPLSPLLVNVVYGYPLSDLSCTYVQLSIWVALSKRHRLLHFCSVLLGYLAIYSWQNLSIHTHNSSASDAITKIWPVYSKFNWIIEAFDKMIHEWPRILYV